MKYYLAPLEGITGYIYRNAISEFYGEHIDKYFIPFIEPHIKRDFNARELNDILPEHNEGMHAIPQVLTKSASDYLFVEKALLSYGYNEININLGCPSGTVATKGRGAGMLADTNTLKAFLDEIFAKTEANISLKTRIGMEEPEEFYEILDIYNQYPLKELIIHPRVREEFYNGIPHMDIYEYAMNHSKNPLCYNGDITDYKSYKNLLSKLQKGNHPTEAVMLGRGMLANPGLVSDLANGSDTALDTVRFNAFHDKLLTDYSATLSGDKNILFKMKELWTFFAHSYPECKKELKGIKKAQNIKDYKLAVTKFMNQICNY